jgi:hypothetical protein
VIRARGTRNADGNVQGKVEGNVEGNVEVEFKRSFPLLWTPIPKI